MTPQGHQRSVINYQHVFNSCVNPPWQLGVMWSILEPKTLLVQVEMVVRLWKDGFTVNDEEFRSYSVPENQDFLDAIKRG